MTVRTRPLEAESAEPIGAHGPGRSVSARVAGWLIVLTGALVALGALLPWAVSEGSSDSGIQVRYGIVTLVLGLVAAGSATTRAIGSDGRLSRNVVPVVALVAGVLTTLTALSIIVGIGTIDLVGSEPTEVGLRLNLTALSGFGMLCASVLAFFRRG